ncbi:hypothetical protein KQX54_012283 [Cotesia glomerata]|uniref:Uncharacterized protein n=1 Tax=Cotesia glomerata TaxID=32391 RepID=A0AAV7I8S0_COTGL|nr:hypothetical protein KQX54_012283 [Cotesia glomerata]
MRIAHGDEVVRSLKEWSNNLIKLAALINRRIFLLKCRANNIIPKHISNNIKCIVSLSIEDHPFKKMSDKLITGFQNSVLSLEIKVTLWKLEQLKKRILEIEEYFKGLVSEQLFNRCVNLSSDGKHIYNYTDVQLPPEVEMILNLEPKFGIEIKEKWNVIPTVIKDLEFGIGAVKLDNCNIAEK